MAVKKTYRVSVKGILIRKKRVLLLRKPNRTWDLPGGRIEYGETAEHCLAREMLEETGLETTAARFTGTWIRRRKNKPDVFTLAFLCRVAGEADRIELSDEHIAAAYFEAAAVKGLKMVEACRRAVLDQIPRRK